MFCYNLQNFCENRKSLDFSRVGHFETFDSTNVLVLVLEDMKKYFESKVFYLSIFSEMLVDNCLEKNV
jgi:hypothetical protein